MTCGTSYTYTVCAFNKTSESTFDLTGVSAKTVLETPTVKVASAGHNSIQVSWNEIAGASGYYVYRLNGTKWTKIKTIVGGNILTYKNIGLTCGKAYKYTVAAYCKVNETKVISDYNMKGVSAKPIPATPKVYVTSVGNNAIKVSWDKIIGANGYYVYRKNGTKWSRIKTITNKDTLSYTNKGLTAGKTYTYTVVAYRTVNETKVRSNYDKAGIGVKVE